MFPLPQEGGQGQLEVTPDRRPLPDGLKENNSNDLTPAEPWEPKECPSQRSQTRMGSCRTRDVRAFARDGHRACPTALAQTAGTATRATQGLWEMQAPERWQRVPVPGTHLLPAWHHGDIPAGTRLLTGCHRGFPESEPLLAFPE